MGSRKPQQKIHTLINKCSHLVLLSVNLYNKICIDKPISRTIN
jgi:hypothetical protein